MNPAEVLPLPLAALHYLPLPISHPSATQMCAAAAQMCAAGEGEGAAFLSPPAPLLQ